MSDDLAAMSLLLVKFYKEQNLVISDLKKIEADENKVYYRVEGTNTVLEEVLPISIVVEYNRQEFSIKTHYLNTAKDDAEIKTMWSDQERTIISFTEDELSKLLEEAKSVATSLREESGKQ